MFNDAIEAIVRPLAHATAHPSMIDQLPNQVFTAFSFLGFILVLIPLPWQLEAWNIGCCCYIFWTAAQSLMLFINSIIWHHNVVNRAPVWCDIAVRLEVASAVAYSASSLCINRRFYKILQGKQPPRPSKWNIPREVVLDLCIGVGIPCLQIPLFYVVQLDRFDIYEDYGCYVDIYVSALAYSLVIVWPLAISIISAGYCAGTIYRLTRHQINLNTLLSGHNNLTRKTYIRIMAFAGVELIGGIPLSSWVLYNALKTYGAPAWVSWSYAHSADSVVQQIPASVWKVINPNHEFDRWMTVACAYIFFAFFGMWSEKAWEHYRLYYRFVAKRCPSISFSFPRFRSSFAPSQGRNEPTVTPHSQISRGDNQFITVCPKTSAGSLTFGDLELGLAEESIQPPATYHSPPGISAARLGDHAN